MNKTEKDILDTLRVGDEVIIYVLKYSLWMKGIVKFIPINRREKTPVDNTFHIKGINDENNFAIFAKKDIKHVGKIFEEGIKGEIISIKLD